MTTPCEDPKTKNPKANAARHKVCFSSYPAPVMAEVAVAMTEGARKYGRHNYRGSQIKASTYYDGTLRHVLAWFEGQDIDPDSGVHHVTKAIASLTVLRDAMLSGTFIDDRPPQADPDWMARMNARAQEIVERYPDAAMPLTREATPEELARNLVTTHPGSEV